MRREKIKYLKDYRIKQEDGNISNEFKDRYMDTIELLRMTVDAKDTYTRGHSDRVSYYATKIGVAFNLQDVDIEILKAGGVFHDIGKISTSDEILFKSERLSDSEYKEIKNHPIKGAYILSVVSMFKDIVPLVKYHHERIDGTGYPEGIKGENIPFLARIISVADAFDAMTSDRKYKSKLKLHDAKNQLLIHAGSQFDENIVEKFIEVLGDFDSMQKDLEYTYKRIMN